MTWWWASVVPDAVLATISAERLDEVVGLRAPADLETGSLLTEASVTPAAVRAADQAVVGVALSPGQLPGEPLLPGDVIVIVETPGAGEAAPATAPAEVEATVLQTHPAAGPSDQVVVDVVVPADRAAELAARVATGRVGVVSMPRER